VLRCPVCRLPLARSDSSYRCPGGHSFDLARSGYVNLLRSNRRSTAVRGDSPGMLRSRRAFLDAGHYAPLGAVLAAIAGVQEPGATGTRFVDAGCGDGWFTARFAAGFPRPPAAGRAWAIDVSRTAAAMAARRYPSLSCAVASVRDLPILDGAVTHLLSVLAPGSAAEFRRVLAAGGRLVTVRPGEDHLVELRRHLYADVRPPGRPMSVEAPQFVPVRRQDVRFVIRPGSDDLRHLLDMTPYAWRAGPSARRAVLGGDDRDRGVTAHFQVTVLRARPT